MYQVAIPIGQTFPVQLVCLQNGQVAFVKASPIGVLFDQPSDKEAVQAIFTEEHFSIDGKQYEYNHTYQYKEYTSMLKWLHQQNLVFPNLQ